MKKARTTGLFLWGEHLLQHGKNIVKHHRFDSSFIFQQSGFINGANLVSQKQAMLCLKSYGHAEWGLKSFCRHWHNDDRPQLTIQLIR